jgi:hyperosmotically inducible periplasmic protein
MRNPNSTSLFLAGLVLASTIAACERAGPRQAAAPPAPNPRGAPAAVRPDPAPQVAAPTPPATPGDAITDSIITARIKASVLSDPGMAGTDVSVNTDRGVVSLTGIIKSQEQAAIASAHAQRQDGVMRVENHLAVNLH